MVFKLPKVMHFLQFCTGVSKISLAKLAKFLKAAKTIKQFNALSENGMVYRVGGFWATVHETLKYQKTADSAEIIS